MSPVRFALCGVLFEERLDRRYPGLAHVDGRAEEGRLLKGIGNGILDHLSAHGGEPTIVHPFAGSARGLARAHDRLCPEQLSGL